MVALLTGISIAIVVALTLAVAGARRLRASVARLDVATSPKAGLTDHEDG